MIWATKAFPKQGWYHVQDRFEAEFETRGDPNDMMFLFADRSDYGTDIFVGLPDESGPAQLSRISSNSGERSTQPRSFAVGRRARV